MMDTQTVMEKRIAEYIGAMTYQHLTRSNLVRDDAERTGDDPLLWVWLRSDRVVVIVNPLRIKNLDVLTSRRFAHHLGTVLQGRRIVVTNHRGIFLQVGYYPEPARELETLPLDLSAQPHALAVPIGMTADGPLWLSIVEMDAVLIGGARRMGKTNLLHGWIAALLQGAQARLILFDGKGGVEFARYARQARCQVVTGELAPVLADISTEMQKRFNVLKAAGAANVADYNRGRGEGARLERILLIVDELAYALQAGGVESVLVDLTARGGAFGIHPILATQRPAADVVTPRLKSNLVTRIALPVPDRASSAVILDRTGAEKIAKTPGRLLLLHGARLVEAQAYALSERAYALNARARANAAQVSGGADRTSGSDAPGAPDVPQLASALLSEREQRLARAAMEREGWFRVRDLCDAVGESVRFVLDVAKKWELMGYLTPVQRDARGVNLGRRVTGTLISQVSSANQVNG